VSSDVGYNAGMVNTLPAQSTLTSRRLPLTPIHILLGVQTLAVVLVSINRLSTLTTGYVLPNEFLRWQDLLNMLGLPLISAIGFYLLKRRLAYASPALEGRAHRALDITFIIGLYLLAASYGAHEVTNYLHIRFCPDEASALCRIISYNDDGFSHYVFFTGFVLINAVILLMQVVFPQVGKLGAGDIALLILNGIFIGAGIFANLAFEEIGLDLYVVGLLAGLAVALLIRKGLQPMFVYYATAYMLGLAATAAYKLAH